MSDVINSGTNATQDLNSFVQPKPVEQPKNQHKVFNILNWIFVGITIFIFCMLIIIASIFFNLYITNRIGHYDDPQVYAMYVTAVTFIIMDLCFMVIWLALVHICFFKGIKYKNLINNKKLYTAANISFLIVFALLNVAVIVLLIIWLGGYASTIDQRIGLVIALAVIALVKALLMVGTLATSLVIIKYNKRNDNLKTI